MMLSTFYSLRLTAKKKSKKTVDVFKGLVSAGINSLFQNNVIGESEESFDSILLQNNALVRIGIRVWYYKFSSKSVISSVESAFCYVFSKSILDRSKLSNDELTYYISEFANICGDNVDDTIKSMSQVYNSISNCKYEANIINNSISNLKIEDNNNDNTNPDIKVEA